MSGGTPLNLTIPGPDGIPTRISLNGGGGGSFPLSNADTVFWEMRPGLAPFIGEFTFDLNRGESWVNSTDETWASLEFDGRVFKRLRILRPVQIDPHHMLIRVADRRHRWKYIRYYGRHNLRRRVNDPIKVVDLLEAQQVQLSESFKRDNLETIFKERYRNWTVKPDGDPYTSKELAGHVMRAILLELDEADAFDVESFDAQEDNGDLPDQSELIGATTAEAMNLLLTRAELQVGVDQGGEVRIYDPYQPLETPDATSLRLKAGYLRVPDLSRIRPATIEIAAQAWHDRRMVFRATGTHETESLDDLTANSHPEDFANFENVIKIPFDDVINGEDVVAGTYVDIVDALSAWSINENDVRTMWFFGGEGLKFKYARRISPLGKVYQDPIQSRRIQAILSSYLQLFRLNPVMMDMIRDWDVTTVSLIDPITRTPQPSPVYMNWTELKPATPLIANSANPDDVMDKFSSFAGLLDGFDISLLKASYEAAPARVMIEGDKDLGVFRIAMLPSLDGTVAERIPGHINNPLNIFDSATRKKVQLFTKAMSLQTQAQFRMEIVMSFMDGAPNSDEVDPLQHKNTFYRRIIEDPKQTGLVPKMMLHLRTESARFNENSELVNAAQIDALMDAEARAAWKSFDDREVGTPEFSHDPSHRWRLSAHVRGIRFQRKPDGKTAVILDAGEPVIQANAIRGLPQSVKNFLQKKIPDDR